MMQGISPKRVAAGGFAVTVPLICIGYIARNFHWREAFTLLSGADPVWFFFGGGGAIIAYWMVRTLRWYFLLRGMRIEVGFLDLYLCSAVTLSLSIYTPIQSGEVLKIELMKKYGHVARLPGYSAFLLERVADLYAVVTMGILALVFRYGLLSHLEMGLLSVLFLALPVAGYLLLHRLQSDGRTGEFLGQIRSGLSSPSGLFMLLLSTFLGWEIVAVGWQACLYSLSIALSFADLLRLLSFVTLASILSFIPGGIGVGEAGTAELLVRYGTSAPLAQAGALILRAYSILVILLGAFHWLLLWGNLNRQARPAPTRNAP